MNVPTHILNWYAGWWLVLAAFVSGALMGLSFHREKFLGGYASFQRRMLRLGHVALAALGMLNVVFSLSPWGGEAAGICLVVGGGTMPAICLLTAWRKPFRHLFFVPVVALLAAVVRILMGGAR